MVLTDTKVRSVKPEDNANPPSDGDGLFRYMLMAPNIGDCFRFGGKQHVMARLAFIPKFTGGCQKEKEEAVVLVVAGIDPAHHKRAVKEEQAKRYYFIAAA